VLLAPFIVSLWVSTVYLRYHYLVDVMAGLILAPLCFFGANWMFKRFGMLQVAVPLPAGWRERLAGRRVARTSPHATTRPEERE
jgi:membrane-associated phospholipid phosphatase